MRHGGKTPTYSNHMLTISPYGSPRSTHVTRPANPANHGAGHLGTLYSTHATRPTNPTQIHLPHPTLSNPLTPVMNYIYTPQ